MSKKVIGGLALAALVSGAPGLASATEGWYGRADAGYSVDGGVLFDAGGNYDHEDDWMGALGFGYAFQNGFRLEGEYGYRSNPQEFAGGGGPAGFDVEATSLMANLIYDFNRGGRFEPYVGAGVGLAGLEFNDSAPSVEVDNGFAWQVLAGLAIGLTERLDLDVGYRYFSIPEIEWQEGLSAGELEYDHHAVTVGLRYQFSAPVAAPPPPAPPPPPPQQPPPPPPPACATSDFVVYFEWDRSNLNQAALETIDAAVARARACNVSGVAIVGHTDTSGSQAYNQRLSERRASVVRDAMVARGMAAAAIQVEARGEADPARATRDGVREPLNRRTAVTIRFR